MIATAVVVLGTASASPLRGSDQGAGARLMARKACGQANDEGHDEFFDCLIPRDRKCEETLEGWDVDMCKQKNIEDCGEL